MSLVLPLRSFWGSTETFGTCTFHPPVSRPAPGTQFCLVDDKGASVPRGEVGELLVRGPSVHCRLLVGARQARRPVRRLVPYR